MFVWADFAFYLMFACATVLAFWGWFFDKKTAKMSKYGKILLYPSIYAVFSSVFEYFCCKFCETSVLFGHFDVVFAPIFGIFDD